MLISVVIPAFNAEAFLDKAIASVLSQTYQSLELIVVNDGSTDRTPEIALLVSDPRMCLITQLNKGTAAARNRGLEVSSGDLIAFLDADDRWDPHKLSIQVRELLMQPDDVAIGSLMRYESRGGRFLGIAGQAVGPADQDQIRRGRLMPFPISSALFLREAVVGIEGFDETLTLAQDLEFLARLAFRGAVACVPRDLGVYLIHDQSASARDYAAQRVATRFVRARLDAKARGNELSWEEFERNYKPTWRQRYGDRVQGLYRRTGLLAAQGRWGAALMSGALAAMLGPRYTFNRFVRQRMQKGRAN